MPTSTSEPVTLSSWFIINKMDEMRLRIMLHRMTVITETWLNHSILSAAKELAVCLQSRSDEGLQEEQRSLH